jgi:glutaconate CoA-transferase, subunit A
MSSSKLTSMQDAIARIVSPGVSVCMGTALEAAIPFAAGHEIIRQRITDLTLICPISDMLFDQLIGAGCVARVIGAWVGNVSAGLGHNYRRAAEKGQPRALAVEDHSNFTIALALLAATLGAPYIPTRSLLGTSLLESNPRFVRATDPFSGDPVVLVPALVPDVTILHVQRSDVYGRCHAWGTLGISREAAFAARQVILVAEEIWPTERIVADPNLIFVPDIKVAAVVHEPWGALPSPLQGCYGRDHDFYTRYHDASRTPDGFTRWLDEWVTAAGDWKGFLDRLGADTFARLKPKRPQLSEPLDYGT